MLCPGLTALQNYNLEFIWAFGQKPDIIHSELTCLMQWNTCPRNILQDSLPGPTIEKVILVSTEEGAVDSHAVIEILRHIR